MSKNFNNTLYQLLMEKNKPMELFTLIDRTLAIKPIKKPKYLIGWELYKLAKKEESHLTIEEYPSFKLHNFRNFIRPPEKGYISATLKILIPSREYIELRDIVRRAVKQRLWPFRSSNVRDTDKYEYGTYASLHNYEYKQNLSQRGALKIGLRQWHTQTASLSSQKEKRITRAPTQTPSARAMINITHNIHEANLESIIVEQLERIEKGLKLVQRQHVCATIGRIDILCKDKHGDWVILELKKFGARHDSLIDQIAKYIGYIKLHLAQPQQKVRGIIVVPKADDKLRYAVSAFPNIEIKTFNLTIE